MRSIDDTLWLPLAQSLRNTNADMKRKTFLASLLGLFCIPVSRAGEAGPLDWNYYNGPYSANVPGDDPTSATINGPDLPIVGISISPFQSDQTHETMIRIVDALAETAGGPHVKMGEVKKTKKPKRR